MKRVLIDTCAWIDFFKSTTGQLGTQVAYLIETDQARVGWAEVRSPTFLD